MSYLSKLTQKKDKKRKVNNKQQCRRPNINKQRGIQSLQSTASVASTSNSSHRNGKQYPMWGNSALISKPKNGFHSTNTTKQTHHNSSLDLHQRLLVTIQLIDPKSAEILTQIIIQKHTTSQIRQLLNDTAQLECRVAIEDYLLTTNKAKPSQPLPTRPKSSANPHTKVYQNHAIRAKPASSKPQRKVRMVPVKNGHIKSYKQSVSKCTTNCTNLKQKKPIRTLNVVNRYHIDDSKHKVRKTAPSKKSFVFNEEDAECKRDNCTDTTYGGMMTEAVDEEAAYAGLPEQCSLRVLRVVVNTMIPNQIFELLLETLCIKKGNSAQKIFIRCHKSIYPPLDDTVIYIHFINFDEHEYRHKRDRYFDFVDDNDKRIGWYRGRVNHHYKTHKRKQNIFDIMGNQLGCIRVRQVKEYPCENDIPVHCLSRIVNICWRCKVNKASARKRVCSFCINDEIEDRKKIGEYYRNPMNNASHKSVDQIQKDLIKLKIELCLIPTMYRKDCDRTNCNSKCTWIHNKDEDQRMFGQYLQMIRNKAVQRQSGGDFDNYRSVKLQLKYRRLIGKYYHKNKTCDDAIMNMDRIKKYLMSKNVKLYLIPKVYINWCYYASDAPDKQLCAKHSVCTFVHDERGEIFGDLLWQIKYDAVQEHESASSIDSASVDLNDDLSSLASDEVKAMDPVDYWWRKTITPYMDANWEEHAADKERMEEYGMDAADIRIKSQAIQYGDHANSHSLFVEFEDQKAAKINLMITRVAFTLKCAYSIHFDVVDEEENTRIHMVERILGQQFMNRCKSMADDLRLNQPIAYRRFRSHVQIACHIASFAVEMDKNRRDCVACHFGLCDGIKHKILTNNSVQVRRTCCGHDLDKPRQHKFDTRKCETLRGVIVEAERRQGKDRYKVLINKKDTKDDTYLKFLIIGSDAFDCNKRRFKDILVRYPCNTHQFEEIKKRLTYLEQGSDGHRRHEITQIIFGFDGRKPRNIYGRERISKTQIAAKLFGGVHALNKSQINAAYGAVHKNLYTLQGPPATGKTDTSSRIAYLWGQLEGNKAYKIHGMAPTNQGTLLLATKCYQINKCLEDEACIKDNIVCDWFIRSSFGDIPRSIGDLCAQYHHEQGVAPFKVLYLSSQTYAKVLQNENLLQKQKNNNDFGMSELERVCVNLGAQYHLERLPKYKSMSDKDRKEWERDYITEELRSANMVCTTFGNSCNRQITKLVNAFTHAIADECNQSALDTILGVIAYPNLKHLTMAGDIRQLRPVSLCKNVLCRTSIYEDIIRYLTDSTLNTNAYYTRLNEQYRSHPQIYQMTSDIFYGGTVKNGPNMLGKRAYHHRRAYSSLFAKKNNHIQWHMLTNKEMELESRRDSNYNVTEARIAVQYVKRFIVELRCHEREIAVISDYRAQIDCVKAHLRKIKGINSSKMKLGTTNEIEGSSRPIVIYMLCRSNHTGNIGFLNDMTRINVATSRAQYAQIIIGDAYTVQYNPVYRMIFNYHQRHDAVVYGDANDLCVVEAKLPLVGVSLKHFLNKLKTHEKNQKQRVEYYVCGGCNRTIHHKLFCGRIVSAPPMLVYICKQCIDRHLTRWCDASKQHKFDTQWNEISPMTIVQKSDFNGADSFGISLEFDLLLARYLVKNGLIKFTTQDKDQQQSGRTPPRELHRKFIDIVKQMVHDLEQKKNWKQHVPQCFQTLAEYNYNESDDIRGDPVRNEAIGIMECRRKHLLRQAMMDARFFRLVYELKNCSATVRRFYKTHKMNFYKHRKFEENQPTFVVVAYLKACGYSTNIANYLQKRVAKLLVDQNRDKPSRNTAPLRLDDAQIRSLSQSQKLDALSGISNVFGAAGELSGHYVIKLVQNAIIDDLMSSYYTQRTHANAIASEESFGDKLRSAGFDYYSEKELQDLGYKCTPDYYLKKAWIVYYDGIKYEITWIDFKNYYCSSTQGVCDELRVQATKYNKTFGPGAFVFSLGFVKVPSSTGLQMNCHGLLAALCLTKDTILKFLRLTSKYKSIVSKDIVNY
eukprot:429642_1